MKYLPIALTLTLAACGGSSNSEAPQELTDIEICLNQSGEWVDGLCRFEGEICLIKAQCKPDAEYCPCIEYGFKDQLFQTPTGEGREAHQAYTSCHQS